jgi:hypothetical protein
MQLVITTRVLIKEELHNKDSYLSGVSEKHLSLPKLGYYLKGLIFKFFLA